MLVRFGECWLETDSRQLRKETTKDAPFTLNREPTVADSPNVRCASGRFPRFCRRLTMADGARQVHRRARLRMRPSCRLVDSGSILPRRLTRESDRLTFRPFHREDFRLSPDRVYC
jgi:hypothetical protein